MVARVIDAGDERRIARQCGKRAWVAAGAGVFGVRVVRVIETLLIVRTCQPAVQAAFQSNLLGIFVGTSLAMATPAICRTPSIGDFCNWPIAASAAARLGDRTA